jgi:hypothetical protein
MDEYKIWLLMIAGVIIVFGLLMGLGVWALKKM